MQVTLFDVGVLVVVFLIVGSLLGSWMARTLRHKNEAVEAAHFKVDGDISRATLLEQVKAAQNTAAQAEERRAQIEAATEELRNRIADLREQNGKLLSDVESRNQNIARLEQVTEQLTEERVTLSTNLGDSRLKLARLEKELEAERSQTQEKLALLEQAKGQMVNQFKALSADILEEKSKKFTEANQLNISQLLTPLREKMNDFRAKVEEIHLKDTEQQAAMKTELAQMRELNRQLTTEAHSLATALKGQSKKQGNWGELILGNVLDRSGLREGKDFKREVNFNTEDGRKRPDAIVYLPQGKHLVIDAKVSLNAYTRFVNADDDGIRQRALEEHAMAVADRIRELSDRNYFLLPGLNTPEMVFMFIPIESAYVEALKADDTLFQTALEKNVLVATPTTLLTSLNIVRQLWRFEEQNAHTAELASRAGKVYKKLVSFLESMDNAGKQLGRAKDSFDRAMGQLVSGKDNLIKQAKDFENLGVSVQTPLPPELAARAELELDLSHTPALSSSSEEDKAA